MVRQSLILAALLVVASPLAAQEEEGWIWTDDRPDAVAPLAVTGTQTVPFGDLHIRYQWIQRNSMGVWFDGDSLDLATVLDSLQFQVAPRRLSDRRHSIEAWLGLTDNLTIHARTEYALMERESVTVSDTEIRTTNSLGDLYADATYNLIRRGAYRMDVNAGAIIPIGPSTTTAISVSSPTTEVPTPYDMRPGSGSFGVFGSVSMNAQNEFGSVGAQFKATAYVNDNSVGFRRGDRYEANGWAAYRFNDYFSVSAGARWEKWGRIKGADEYLEATDARRTSDPMNNGVSLGGIRASMPLGINFVFPEDMILGGHRLAFETMYVLHHDYDGPQLGLDWGINIGYTARLPVVPF